MTENMSDEKVLFLKNKKGIVLILLILFLLAGIGIRLLDFTDMPLDFAGTRQLHSLIMTRGFYYQMDTPDTTSMPQDLRSFGINAGKAEPVIEPPLMEYLVAFIYSLIGGENIFVGRILSIFFWVIGGIPLFLMARRLISVNGAFAALAFYLFTHFGVYASRSFQPDPMMVMWILWALYFQVRWSQEDSLKNGILAGVFTGIAILVKAPSIFFTGIPFAALVLRKGFKYWIKNWQVYLMAALAILPAFLYNFLSATVGGQGGSIFGARFFPQLWIDYKWYLSWLKMLKSVAGHFVLLVSLFGFFLISRKETRWFYGALWLGYALFSFVFAYHISTHNYYHLPMLPIIALGFGVVFSMVYSRLEAVNKDWLNRILIAALFVFSYALCLQRVRGSLIATDYRYEEVYWTELGNKIDRNASVIALTQDYGYRINYWGYINPTLWPTSEESTIKNLQGATDPAFQQMFKELTAGKTIFLVTIPGEFETQPELKEWLFGNYRYDQGDGYYIFYLNEPLNSSDQG